MTSARCGATYLSQLLGSTGCLGRPEDWFNGKGYRNRGFADYPLDREAQLAMVTTRGMSANGVFGLKMSVNRCDELRGFDWADRLAPLTFIHLGRRDQLARAISDVMAEQTQQYRSTSAVHGERRYDAKMIHKALARHATDEARISQYFALNGILPLAVDYEDIVADEGELIQKIAGFLGVQNVPEPDKSGVTLQVQRDALNAEWHARFLAENADLNVIPALKGRSKFMDYLTGRGT